MKSLLAHLPLQFQHPAVLWLLVPIALFALWMSRPGRAHAVVYSSTDVVRAVGAARRTRWGAFLPALRWLAAASIVVSLARPFIERRDVKIQASGVDIMLAIDVSGSMQARDMAPEGDAASSPSAIPGGLESPDSPERASEPDEANEIDAVSRLDAAKAVIGRFVEGRPNDRIGLVAFAGAPYLASPLTLDHDWVVQNLARLDSNQLADGTAIGSAIAAGTRRLDAQAAKSKILIVLTDGQSNAGKIAPSAAAEAAKALGVKVYIIGVGSSGDALVPTKDEAGQTHLVKARVDVDEAAMKQVAEATGGKFYRATDTRSLDDVYREIDRFEKTTRAFDAVTQHEERFAWFAMPGIFLLLAEIGLSSTRFRRVP